VPGVVQAGRWTSGVVLSWIRYTADSRISVPFLAGRADMGPPWMLLLNGIYPSSVHQDEGSYEAIWEMKHITQARLKSNMSSNSGGIVKFACHNWCKTYLGLAR